MTFNGIILCFQNKVTKKKKKTKLSDEKRLAMKVAPKAEKA